MSTLSIRFQVQGKSAGDIAHKAEHAVALFLEVDEGEVEGEFAYSVTPLLEMYGQEFPELWQAEVEFRAGG